ncbi:Rpn family recombination-promoting nuclease/putative transposase [Desulfobotulus mexicanus]|uniref:Rpn family recombination-promoting nuclease/putative transposase n=2 Tax=Desulfobotulus mexicanus TaxID=2586642 RepID=A0A5S5MBI9_9BACT|nr:Rpn family recombination-promoting nuclease/putative transposase [Desulfobotulus mexicanus]
MEAPLNQMLTDFYVKPTSDIFFRYLFGMEEHKPMLIDFINGVLKDSGFPLITDLEIKNPFNLQTIYNEKESILDIKAKSVDDRWFDVEMQNLYRAFFMERVLYYWASMYREQLGEGEDYSLLRPAMCINILDFKMFKHVNRHHLCFMLREKDMPELMLTDHLALHFLELPKITDYNVEKTIDMWLYYLKNEGLSREDKIMDTILKNNPHIASAREKYIRFTQDEHMREAYESHLKWKRDHKTDINYARREGEEIGTVKGMYNEKYQTIMRLSRLNLNPQDIAAGVGLTPEQVKAVIDAGDKGLDLLIGDDATRH